MENSSGLHPKGRAVLVEPYEPEVKKGLIAIPETVSDRLSMLEQCGVVVEVGPEAWKDEAVPRARPGDHVMISRMAGVAVKGRTDGKTYRVVNANEIFLGLDV